MFTNDCFHLKTLIMRKALSCVFSFWIDLSVYTHYLFDNKISVRFTVVELIFMNFSGDHYCSVVLRMNNGNTKNIEILKKIPIFNANSNISNKIFSLFVDFQKYVYILKIMNDALCWYLLRVNKTNENPISTVTYGSPRRHSNSSKTFKKIGKNIINLYDHFRTSWIIQNDEQARPDLTVTLFDGFFFRNVYNIGTFWFWYYLYSSLLFVLLKFGIDIFDSLETMCFSAT